VAKSAARFLYRVSHPLGEHVVESAKTLVETPLGARSSSMCRIIRRASMPSKRFVARVGFLSLTRFVVESYEREEYLLFSGFDDSRRFTRPGDDGENCSAAPAVVAWRHERCLATRSSNV
jgi:hypothetical protein